MLEHSHQLATYALLINLFIHLLFDSGPGFILDTGMCEEQDSLILPALALFGLLSCWLKDLPPCRSQQRNVL